MSFKVFDVAPGITRIESILGPRPFSQYLLRGGERSLLVDTGTKDTPGEVLLPALDGLQPDVVLISHADVDHFGGTAAIRAVAPGALVCAHALDTPWIEDPALIMRERYGWYEAYGIAYDAETFAWLRDAMGPPVPVDLRLRGHEVFRLGSELEVEVLPLPGHSPGHIGLWEPRSRTAIVIDAILGAGLLDTEGNVIHPPPVVDVPGYEGSIRLLRELDPAQLLTAHYDVIEGDAVGRFLDESLAFIERTRALVASLPDQPLAGLLERADRELGPFTSMPNELAATIKGVLLESGRQPIA